MEQIIKYRISKYHPSGMIVYGSYANGTNNQNSDFDAILICGETAEHDHSIVDRVELDVYLYPKSFFDAYEIQDFVQIWDGKIIVDDDGLVSRLKQEAISFVQNYPRKSAAENAKNIAWCEKMLKRTRRNDFEGLYRLHWLLVDSLEIYFDVKGLYYFGPKKALKQMELTDPQSAEIYFRALQSPDEETLSGWIDRIKNI